jgi:hypothetical protein
LPWCVLIMLSVQLASLSVDGKMISKWQHGYHCLVRQSVYTERKNHACNRCSINASFTSPLTGDSELSWWTAVNDARCAETGLQKTIRPVPPSSGKRRTSKEAWVGRHQAAQVLAVMHHACHLA